MRYYLKATTFLRSNLYPTKTKKSNQQDQKFDLNISSLLGGGEGSDLKEATEILRQKESKVDSNETKTKPAGLMSREIL